MTEKQNHATHIIICQNAYRISMSVSSDKLLPLLEQDQKCVVFLLEQNLLKFYM